MIRINLLPHREQKRERRKRDFVGSMVMSAMVGGGLVFLGGMVINQQIENQQERNALIERENANLDVQIAEIKDLEAAIASLKARQVAVEDLQSDRTMPVHLFDELVKLIPEGVFLDSLEQRDLTVSLVGKAQSNERVAELLRNLSERSPWLEKPQLQEIREENEGRRRRSGSNVHRAQEFRLNVLIKRQAPENRPQVQGRSVTLNSAANPQGVTR
ncbi:MAG: PilN domain-containing protein [Lautropia sp.]|nr:PilN domain-containing protein [Lautropia sp.]